MDRHGNRIMSPEELLLTLPEKEVETVPRKITPEEYFSSPAFQRRQKLVREAADRAAFEKKVAFRSAQEQNPIKPKPRRKRNRKVRSR
ncbi:MAG: hypothetical protein OXH00_26035 [Candidatus Poribacteria bacterium]|nr:hypothetical protein [Candidatus Poribacteria bacterium]